MAGLLEPEVADSGLNTGRQERRPADECGPEAQGKRTPLTLRKHEEKSITGENIMA